jgi:hypothetical protein
MKKKTDIVIADDALEALAVEIKATFTERVFNARDEMINAHHETGRLISEHVGKRGDAILLVKQLVGLGAGTETTLYLSLAFFKRFPKLSDLDQLGHGKNISWNKIRAAIAEPKADCTHGHTHTETIVKCDDCGKTVKDV